MQRKEDEKKKTFAFLIIVKREQIKLNLVVKAGV